MKGDKTLDFNSYLLPLSFSSNQFFCAQINIGVLLAHCNWQGIMGNRPAILNQGFLTVSWNRSLTGMDVFYTKTKRP